MVFLLPKRQIIGLVKPIYAIIGTTHACTNAREVVLSILKLFPKENFGTLAGRARVIEFWTIKQWIERNTASADAMERLFSSILKDYS
jgi:hypothetical protein